MIRKILQFKLKILSKIILKKYKPYIVGITGSVGKTGTKEAVYRVLKKRFRVRKNKKNYNNEIGVPLTVIGVESGQRSFFGWIKVFLRALRLIFCKRKYPEILVLEMAIDRPGDMSYLMSFIKPHVGIMTAIGEFPVHLEFFPDKGRLVEEKSKLIKELPPEGMAILNYDDLAIRDVGRTLDRKTIYYGFGEGANLQICNFQTQISDLERKDFGLSFKLDYQGSIIPIKLNRILGRQQSYAATAATAVGLFFGMNLVDVASALAKYRPLSGRSNLIKGIKNSWILDDSYNASPSSVLAALETLEVLSQESSGSFDYRRKIVVLGDMLELGVETEKGHRQVGQKAVEVSNLIFTIGDRARFIADEAKAKGFPEDKIFQFSTSEEAGRRLQKKIKKGDVILVKGSRSMHTEEAIREIMAKPHKADKLLVK